MKRSTWLRRTLWIIALIFGAIFLIGFLLFHHYQSSAWTAHEVAKQLQESLGGRVVVETARVGFMGNSSALGIQVYEDSEPNKPWIQIDEASVGMSVLSFLRDKALTDVQLRGVRITLRFDSDGHLLTRLPTKKKAAPSQLPRVHIDGGQLTFDQQHRTPMIIRGIQADIAPNENAVTLAGTVQDPFWGDWKVHGDIDSSAGKSSIVLNTEQVAVTMDKLKAIAFVPLSTWREVHVEGSTPAEVRLNMDASRDKLEVHYRVAIAPNDAHVQVPSIDLDATHAHGKAIIDDEIVLLDDVHGKTAGGSITTSGKLNFHDEPTRLTFKVGVQDVMLHDLPRSWKVPNTLEGKLNGSADLVLTIKNGKVETAGSGEGIIREAKWSGFSIDKPVRLALRSEGGRFRFHQPETASGGDAKLGDSRSPSPALKEAPPITPNPAPAEQLLAFQPAIDTKKKEQTNDGMRLRNAPTQMINLLGRSIQMSADGVARGINATADALGKLKPPSKPGEEPTYLDVDFSLKDVDLAQLVKKLGLNLPYPITGRLTFQVHASIPVNTANDLKAYRLRGTAHLSSIHIDGLAMTEVDSKVHYADGVLDLQGLHGRMPGQSSKETSGKFEGNVRVQIVPRGDLQASLNLDQIPLDTLLSMVPEGAKQITGSVSGNVRGRGSLEKLSDPTSWRGKAKLTAPQIEAYGIPLQNASVGLIVDEKGAHLSTFKADLEGAPLTGNGNVQFTGVYPFQASVDMERGDLTTLNRLAPAFRPPFELKGRTQLKGSIQGTLKPFQFDTTGQLSAQNLIVERFAVDDVSFRWSKEQNDLKLDAINMTLYGGSISGTALLPLSAAAPGSADLTIRSLNVQAMAKALPTFPVRVEGKVSGTVKGQLSAAKGERPRTWASNVELTAPQLRVQGIPAEKLKGSLESRGGKTSYDLQGETLGGTFSLKGDLPDPTKKKPAQEPIGQGGPELLPVSAVVASAQKAEEPAGRGRFELNNARLSQLWAAYDINGGLAHLNGRFSIHLDYELKEPGFFPAGSGTFRIVNIAWDDDFLGDSLQGDVRLSETSFDLNNISGEVAGGLFLGRFSFGLRSNAQGSFRIELQQVDASRLLIPIPAVASHVKGPADVSLRGRIGPVWSGGGGVTLARGQIYGMEVTEWRIPLSFSFSPSQGTGELTVRDSNARIAQGRARFESTMNWGNGLRLAGQLLFYQVDLRTLLQHSPSAAAYVSGRVSGRVDLAGSEMRSLNDLTAEVRARMEQGQALQLPVLRQLTPYLRPGVSQSRFQSGELRGRLAGGIFRIQRATLVGEFLKLLIVGTINLAGNLDLDVTAQTGLYCLNPAQTDSLRTRIPIIGAIPRLILYEISSLLSAAVVHLQVTGTVHSPVIRVEPLLLMTEESIRFFLGRAVGLDVPNLP